jgi:hypothetical protein
MFVGCAEIAPKWEIREYHDNMIKHGKCCWEVKGDEEEGDDISYDDKEETMENVAYVGQCYSCQEQNLMREGWGDRMFSQGKVGEQGHEMDFESSDEETDNDQMEYTNYVGSDNESYYYVETDTKRNIECLMTERVTEMNVFLKKVAVGRSLQKPEEWAQKVEDKLDKSGIQKVSDIMTNVFRIIHGLKKKALSELYMTTLKEMFQEGINTTLQNQWQLLVANSAKSH